MSEFEYGFTDEYYDGSAYEEGRSDAINEVLEIIDKRIKHSKPVSTLLQARAVSELNHVKHDILALKGGEQE